MVDRKLKSAMRLTVTRAHSVSRKNGGRGAGTSSVTRRVAAIATVVLLGGVVGLSGPGSATAASTASTFTELSTAFAAGGTVTLGNDITGSALNVGAGQTVTLDLAGHSLSVSGNVAIGVPGGTTLIIVDTSGDGTVTATGGAAGIGSGIDGANGVNPAPRPRRYRR